MAFENFPYTNFHDLNLDWILEKMKESVATIEALKNIVDTFPAVYEKSADITYQRKLSSTGNLTGTINGRSAFLTLAQIDSNADKIKYISDQFSDGQTGLVIDGAFFESEGIHKAYNGGLF